MKFNYKLEYCLMRFFVFFILIMPEFIRYKIAKFLGLLSYYLIAQRRKIAYKNLKLAFPEKADKEINKISKECFKNTGIAFLSSLWNYKIVGDDNKVSITNEELLKEALKKDKAVIVAVSHLGNFESSLKVALKYNLYDVVRRQKNPLIDKYMNDNREKTGVNLIYKGENTTKMLLRAIKEKAVIALLSDHHTNDVEVKFFGRKTNAAAGAVSLALRYDIPLLFAYSIIKTGNKFETIFQEEIILEKTGDTKKDIENNVQKLMYKFEEIIKKYPEQWTWYHKRWRD